MKKFSKLSFQIDSWAIDKALKQVKDLYSKLDEYNRLVDKVNKKLLKFAELKQMLKIPPNKELKDILTDCKCDKNCDMEEK